MRVRGSKTGISTEIGYAGDLPFAAAATVPDPGHHPVVSWVDRPLSPRANFLVPAVIESAYLGLM